MTMDPGKLRERLRGIVRPLGSGAPVHPSSGDAPAAVGVEGEASGAPLQKAPAVVRASGVLERVLGGEWRSRDGVRSFVVTRRFEADAPYGHGRVGDFAARLTAAQGGASLLAAGTPRVPFVFFDLETTGLSGGAGTHAFLVGCSWFDDTGAFVVEQHLMADYASERGMLTFVAMDLAAAGALVTFNGKSFDAPVIETRYLFHRLTSPCAQIPHVDVLHPARRFWGGDPTLGCSLIALEQQLLGARREGDVPGCEIPERYFQFIRSGDAQPLADVFEHNRLDLLSLAGLTARLLTLVSAGASATDDEREAYALGRVYERADETGKAEHAFERAVELASVAIERGGRRRPSVEWVWTPQGIRAEAIRALALSARRARRYSEAAARWRQLLGGQGCPPAFRREATEALAIHHEHRDRDLAAARLFALESLDAGSEKAWGDAVRHRLARLERKLVTEQPSLPSLPSQQPCGSPRSGRRTSS